MAIGNCPRIPTTRRSIAVTGGVVFTTLALSGCLVTRVAEVRDQACDLDANFNFVFGEQPGIEFNNPVLLDQDIVWLAGSPPTQNFYTASGRTLVYVIEKDVPEPDSEESFRIELDFLADGPDHRLQAIRFDPRFSLFFNPEILDSETLGNAAQNVCEAGLSLASTRQVLDLSEQDLADLPDRREMLEWLGPPLEYRAEDDSYHYAFRIRSEQASPEKAEVTVWFDPEEDRILRMDSRYSRFETTTDVDARTLALRVSL